MNRYRTVPGLSGQQKASATTVCQKCLKKDIYECKASTQERPYVSRPSRTQQLLNPKLAPKLTSDVPNDLLRREGVADEQLAKKAEERGRTFDRPSVSPPPSMSHARKRSRSVSASSTDSVSTISTDRSLSPKRARRDSGDRYITSQREYEEYPRYPSKDRKRRRRSSSSASESRSDLSVLEDRPKGNGRRRRRTVSPEPRGRPAADRRGSHRSRSRSRSLSVDQSRVARERKSMTPVPVGTNRSAYDGIGRGQENRPSAKGRGDGDRRDWHSTRDSRSGQEAPPRKERSLSPYSKRIALTQAMNLGR